MIGNDIVDLNLAAKQSNWQRKGFLDKVFTEKEQHLILNSEDPFKMVWRLWSMKESVYKAYVQQHLKRFFSPIKLECFLTNIIEGCVVINNKKYATLSVINSDYIYTTATLNASKKEVNNHCFHVKDSSIKNQRSMAYHQLKAIVSNTCKLSFYDLEIKKTVAGIPKIHQKNNILDIHFSITHHGNYGVISILKIKKP